jgi:hypothetical protein
MPLLKKIFRVVAGLLCLIGAGFALLLITALPFGDIRSPSHNALGVVTGYHRELTGRSMDSLRYYPMVDYTNVLGKRWSFTSFSPLKKPLYPTGTVVSVLYDPHENPKRRFERIAEPPSGFAAVFWHRWVLIVLAVSSLVMFAITGYALLNGRPIRNVIRSIGRRDALPDKACPTR